MLFLQFAQVTSNIIEAIVSINRLSSYLNASELQADARKVSQTSSLQTGDVVLSIENGSFSWSSKAVSPTLEDISLTARKGELVGVLGRVGAGKVRLRVRLKFELFKFLNERLVELVVGNDRRHEA